MEQPNRAPRALPCAKWAAVAAVTKRQQTLWWFGVVYAPDGLGSTLHIRSIGNIQNGSTKIVDELTNPGYFFKKMF